MTTASAVPVRDAPGRAVRWGFLAAALVDGLASLALHREDLVGGRAGALALAFAAGHVVALGLVLGALADAAARWLPRRRWLAPLAAFGLAWLLGFAVFREDFSVFPLPIRIGLTAAAAAPMAGLVALWSRASSWRPAAFGAPALAIGVVAGSQLALDASYPGIHLAAHVFAGLLAALALVRAASRVAGRAGTVLDGALVAVAALSLVLWPSNAVLVALARIPTAAVVPLLAEVREGGSASATTSEGVVSDEALRPWFEDRAAHPPIGPTRPALFGGEPIVILLTVDALRADAVLGDDPAAAKATKNLRRLASRGASFTLARSSASSTSPSLSAMFTGKYYSSLYWSEMEERGKLKVFLPEEKTVRFPELLQRAGVDTAYVLTAGGFQEKYGVARGMTPLGDDGVNSAAKVIPRIVDWLKGLKDQRAFVWSHILDPHYPYVKGPKNGKPRERWLGEVAEVDKHLGKLDAAIGELGLRDRTYLILSADHGEALGQHGTKTHATTVYEELVRIPLIVVGPGVKKRTVGEPVSLLDVGPTVLDLFGLETPGHFMGESLVPLLAGKKVKLTRPIILDAGRRKQAIIGRDGIKAIRNLREKTTELYDLKADPLEKNNLLEDRPDLARERLGQLETFFRTHELRKPGYTVPYRE